MIAFVNDGFGNEISGSGEKLREEGEVQFGSDGSGGQLREGRGSGMIVREGGSGRRVRDEGFEGSIIREKLFGREWSRGQVREGRFGKGCSC